MPTDQIGNPLLVGDLVSYQSGDQTLLCQVVKIDEPSVISPGTKDQMHLIGAVVMVPLPLRAPFDVRNPRCANICKVVKPPGFGQKEN